MSFNVVLFSVQSKPVSKIHVNDSGRDLPSGDKRMVLAVFSSCRLFTVFTRVTKF